MFSDCTYKRLSPFQPEMMLATRRGGRINPFMSRALFNPFMSEDLFDGC